MSTSGKFTAAARTRTRTVPGVRAGRSISSTRTTSGAPYSGQTAARTVSSLLQVRRDPVGRALLHERPHALARLVGVVDGPEHRLVIDEAVTLVQHPLDVHARGRRGAQHLLGRLSCRVPQVV